MANQEPEVEVITDVPAADEVRAELQRVLQSEAFQQAGRASQFLRFIVEETLASRGDRLKGYTIAVEVFERPTDFDAQTDPLVRVEAGRLRRRLMEHYLADGIESPVRIELPRGRYTPTFRYAAPARRATDPTTEPPSAPTSTRASRLAIAAVLAVVALVAFASLRFWQPELASAPTATTDAAPAPSPPGEPRLLVLPFADLSRESVSAGFAAGLTEETIGKFVNLSIIAIASGTSPEITKASLVELRTQFDAGYVLTGSVRPTDGGVRIAVRVLETGAGTQLWTKPFDEPLEGRTETALQEDVANRIALILASPWGPIYANEIRRVAETPTEDLTPFECLLRFYGYAQLYDPALHAASRTCLERAVKEEPKFASGWSALATLYLHEHTFRFNPRQDPAPPLERALEAARRSLDLDGTGRVGGIVLVGIRFAAGDDVAFERAVERTVKEPQHPAVQLNMGYLLALNGDCERSLPLLDGALPLTSDPPGWVPAAYAFCHLQAGKPTDALDSALRIDAPEWFVAPMTVAAAAALSGRSELAKREAARLLEIFPDFETAGPEQLEKWNIDEGLAKILLDGLRQAGLSIH
jgi:TolB-like protein/tetratricopeptide (TPR) repeat protein